MSSLEVHDAGLHDLVARMPHRAHRRWVVFTEGPVWRDGQLLFSDIPNQRIAALAPFPRGPELTTYATGRSNGLTLDATGTGRRGGARWSCVSRFSDNGQRTVLAERFEGKRLNSPNDIVVKSDGSIYFTDPPYGVQPGLSGPGRPGLVDRARFRARNCPAMASTASDRMGRSICWWMTSRYRMAWPSPRRVGPVRRRFGPQAYPGVRGCGRMARWPTAVSCWIMASDDPGVPDGSQGGSAGQSVLHRAGRGVGLPPGRHPAGTDSSSRSCRRTWPGARMAASSS